MKTCFYLYSVYLEVYNVSISCMCHYYRIRRQLLLLDPNDQSPVVDERINNRTSGQGINTQGPRNFLQVKYFCWKRLVLRVHIKKMLPGKPSLLRRTNEVKIVEDRSRLAFLFRWYLFG